MFKAVKNHKRSGYIDCQHEDHDKNREKELPVLWKNSRGSDKTN